MSGKHSNVLRPSGQVLGVLECRSKMVPRWSCKDTFVAAKESAGQHSAQHIGSSDCSMFAEYPDGPSHLNPGTTWSSRVLGKGTHVQAVDTIARLQRREWLLDLGRNEPPALDINHRLGPHAWRSVPCEAARHHGLASVSALRSSSSRISRS